MALLPVANEPESILFQGARGLISGVQARRAACAARVEGNRVGISPYRGTFHCKHVMFSSRDPFSGTSTLPRMDRAAGCRGQAGMQYW
jgi:hypothetical protein